MCARVKIKVCRGIFLDEVKYIFLFFYNEKLKKDWNAKTILFRRGMWILSMEPKQASF